LIQGRSLFYSDSPVFDICETPSPRGEPEYDKPVTLFNSFSDGFFERSYFPPLDIRQEDA